MAKRTITVQNSFNEGMIDGVKQDEPFESNPVNITSVLWLENYNHTLQQDAVIKRWGEEDSGIPYLDLAYFTPNEPYEYVVNVDNTTELERSSWVQGVQIYDIVHPEYNTNYTTFLKRYPNLDTGYSDDYIPQSIKDATTSTGFVASEAVAVVSYTVSTKDAPLAWQEVWADGNLTYSGWYTFGTLADVTRYGETLLFTTTLELTDYYILDGGTGKYIANPVNEYLFPVYRYLYWDIRKKRDGGNQFLTGLADYNNLDDPAYADDFAKWKVLTPSQFLLNNLSVGFTNGPQQGVDITALGGGGSVYDINVCIEECVSVGYKVDHIPPNQTIQTSKYYPTWNEDTFNQQAGEDDYKAMVPQSEVFSVEELDLELMNRKVYGGEYGSVINGTSDNGTGANTISMTRRSNAVNKRNGVPASSLDAVLGIYASGPPDGSMYFGVTALEQYTESKSPRMFLYKEPVDIVLTANINGVDVLLFRGVYEVRQEPMLPIFAAGIPGGNTHYRFDLPWLDGEDDLGDIETTLSESYSTTYYPTKQGGKFYVQGRAIGTPSLSYHLYHVYGTLIYFTIDIRRETLQLLIDSNCSSISLWAIKPDSNRHILKSIGSTVESPSGNIYNKPLIQGNENVDYSKYALLKKFVIDGYTAQPTTYENWTGNPLSTNAWYQRTDASSRVWATAVPLNSLESGLTDPMGLPVFPNDGQVTSYLDGNTTIWDDNEWTPDFVIWDYPTQTTLLLNSSGKYWKGLGARLITTIKGRTFIGGGIGPDGIEEQAIIRYSDVQGGAISPDIFSEERKLQVGHQPHTALLEFREQLWAFSRYQFYRIQMPSITDETSWEFLDVVEQGTFNQKSFTVVPYGVCFCNEAGVWISEGGEPQNVAMAIIPTYQSISSGTNYKYATLNTLPGVPYINSKGYNPYLELNYDSLADELIVSTPLFETVPIDGSDELDYKAVSDFSMIFSFKKKSWRIETSVVPEYEVTVT